MNIKILKAISKNADLSVEDIAVIAGISVDEVKKEIEEMKNNGLIRGYKAVIDWEKLDEVYVSAIVELKVAPQVGIGFEEIAQKVAKYHEVESVYLLSGVSDLSLVVKCKTFQDVARFVAKELATMEGIASTKTQFIMRRYKELDVDLDVTNPDERGVVSSC